ncbi:MAG: type 4a pilus biogenesis protein PilO [Methylophilaceae bacterium]|nr:type 4a pilus biogenesis protein PilO [Methylophilaceae bacterium]
MQLDDFKNIDFKNAGGLPYPVKGVLLLVMFLVLIAIGYWFVWQGAYDELSQARAHEVELKTAFIQGKEKAVKVAGYKVQMADIQKTFGALLRQLPDKTQMSGLLTDINKAGLINGLEFELFKPGDEVKTEFYAEKPIQIKVTGSYDNLGAFATEISRLSRIVTLNDLNVGLVNKDSKDSVLSLEAVAKTYRYLDKDEIQQALEAKKVAKP